jgi:tight adherence protein B
VGSAIAALGGAIVAMSLLPNILFSLLMAGVAALVPSIVLTITVHRRSDKLHGQLADVLMILASSLRAGHSFMQALDMVAKEIGDPAAHEFGRVVAETRLGRPVNEAMDALAERIGSEDFKWALLAVNIQREVGGNLAEILDTVSDTMRERDTIRRQIGVLTAEGRLSIAILTGLPVAVGLYMAKVNPTYIKLLFSTKIGVVMTFTACCLLTVGVAWMRKVVKIDV